MGGKEGEGKRRWRETQGGEIQANPFSARTLSSAAAEEIIFTNPKPLRKERGDKLSEARFNVIDTGQ